MGSLEDGAESAEIGLHVASVVVSDVLVQCVDCGHLFSGELEVENSDVLDDALDLARLGDSDGVTLDGPAEQDLLGRLGVGGRNGNDRRQVGWRVLSVC